MRRPTPRTITLWAAAVLATGLLVASPSAGSSLPRGVLSTTEYRELLTEQNALAHMGLSHHPGPQTRRICRALTNLSPLMAAQLGMCRAWVPFSDDFLSFLPGLKRCESDKDFGTAFRCLYRTVDNLDRTTATVLRTNGPALTVARRRGFTGKCLDMLVLTRNQNTSLHHLARGLRAFGRALATVDVKALQAQARPIDADYTAAVKAMLVTGTVKVCRHA